MSRLLLISPTAFEVPLDALADQPFSVTRLWQDSFLHIEPAKIVDACIQSGAGVVCLGPDLPTEVMVAIAEAFDRDRPDLCVVLLAQPTAALWAAALRAGGVLLLHDEHPAGACLDAFGRWRGDYFAAPGLGELVTAVTRAGLTRRGLEEWPGKDARVPGHLVLAAEKTDA